MHQLNLNDIAVKSPCTVSWATMTGDERARFCKLCKLNVYNLSGMTNAEAEDLLQAKEGRLCVRYIKRADGTVLTKDCGPVRAQRMRRAVAITITAALALIVNAALWFERKSQQNTAAAAQPELQVTPSQRTFDRTRSSKLYQSNPQVRSVVDWTERGIDPRPRPEMVAMGLMQPTVLPSEVARMRNRQAP